MIRTRFAPSPTGYMHIGNLRTALYAYCLARHHGGQFVLRIEDTDRKRNIPKSIQTIYDSLALAGLDTDEGPDKGGPYGPYIQSQCKAQGIYRQYAEALLERGAAYRCFCQKEDSDEQEQMDPSIPRRDPCRWLSAQEVADRLAAGEDFAIRQRIPAEGATTFHDLVYGDITIQNDQLDDQILLKSDDYPTYNFANVVDDHLMQITHVLRGVDYLSSTPKYNLLYESLDWEIPVYIHLPLIVKETGGKLSKRKGDASFQDLIAKGFLPEAIVNAVALLGWSPGTGREFFSLPELVEAFDVDGINKSNAAFSLKKLEWLNGEHLRALAPDSFHLLVESYYPAHFKDQYDTALISQMIQSRLTVLNEIPEMTRFFNEVAPYDLELFIHGKSKSTLVRSLQVLSAAQRRLPLLSPWTEETIRQTLKDYAQEAGLKTGTVMWPVRVALSGQLITPGGATEIAAALGKQQTLARIEAALQRLQAAQIDHHPTIESAE